MRHLFYCILLVLVVIALLSPPVVSRKRVGRNKGYRRIGKCRQPKCKYNYISDGQTQDQRGREVSKLQTEVELRCESVGIFKGERVNLYCLKFKKLKAQMFEKTRKGKKRRNRGKIKSKSLKKKWFCFIRNNKGKVLAVFHHHKEKSYIINFKKTVTSAFQANFAKTKTAKETDPESRHTAHYTYKKKGRDTIEHTRTINTADVSKFAGKVKKKNSVAFKSKENIKVGANQVIREVRGTSITSLSKKNKKEEQVSGKNQDIPPIETKRDYTLKLKKCSRSKKSDVSEEWAWLSSNKPVVVDDLMATYNEREHDEADMEELYEDLPELEQTVQHYHKRSARSNTGHNEEDHALLKWGHLLQLEAKYGALKGRKPKIITLVNRLEEILAEESELSRNLRMTIYNLLSLEGSHTAQKALLSALYNKHGTDEYDSIVMAITLLQAIEHSTLLEYKTYIMGNGTTADEHLLLSLATLGRHKNVEQEVIDTILMEGQRVNDTEGLVHFIHALGNTGSNLIIPYLTPLLLDSSVHRDIQLTVIDALRTVSTNETVWTLFNNLISNGNLSFVVTSDHVLAIIESLKFPYESFLYYSEQPDTPEDNKIFNELLSSIVQIAIDVGDPQVHNATVSLLEHFETKLANELMNHLVNPTASTNATYQRAKRASWNSRKPIFNLISSYSSRQNDLQTYPYNKAYLWGKKLGPSKIHANLAVGGFSGVGASGFKVFGKGLVNLYVFGRTVNVVHLEYLALVRKGLDASTKQYVKIMGSTLLQKYRKVPLPYRQVWTKNHFRIQVMNFQYRVFVYIGFLKFYIQASVSFDTNVALEIDWRRVGAEVSVGPTFTIRGGAEVTLLIFFKIGLEIKASIGYYVTPKASVHLCRTNPASDASACFGIFHGSKGLFVDIYAFYNRRKCSISGWKFWKWRCRWKKPKILRLFSSNFKIAALSQRLLWGKCLGCSCKRGPIHNACSAITRQQSFIAPSEAETSSLCSCKSTTYY